VVKTGIGITKTLKNAKGRIIFLIRPFFYKEQGGVTFIVDFFDESSIKGSCLLWLFSTQHFKHQMRKRSLL
jgi:hypothetical protein